MKKTILIMLTLLCVSANAQIRFNDSQYWAWNLAIDPTASVKEKGLNLTTEVEGVIDWGYIKGTVQTFPTLEGGYIDYGMGLGVNLKIQQFDNDRAYLGVRMAQVWRGGYPYGTYGAEGGYDYFFWDNTFIGLRATYEKREDFRYSGADPDWRFSGFVRIGVKF